MAERTVSILAVLQDRLSKPLAGMGAALKRTGDRVAKVGQAMTKAGRQMSVAGGVVVGALGLITRNVQKYADEVDRAAKITGLTTDALQRLTFAAELNSASQADIVKGFKTLSKTMLDVQFGLTEAKRVFDALGVSVVDVQGNVRDSREVFFEVADALAGMEDQTKKVALATTIFGRAGLNLIPTLNLGSARIRELGDEAQELGGVMSEELVARFDTFDDTMLKVTTSLRGIAVALGEAMIPTLETAADFVIGLNTSVQEFIRENREWAEIIFEVVGAIGAALAVLGPLTIALGVLGQGLGFVISGLGNVVTGFSKLIPFLAANPWLLAAAAIAAVSAAIIKLGLDIKELQRELVNTQKRTQDIRIEYELYQRQLRDTADVLNTTEDELEALSKSFLDQIGAVDSLSNRIKVFVTLSTQGVRGLGDLAESLGVSADEIERWVDIADSGADSADNFRRLVNALSIQMESLDDATESSEARLMRLREQLDFTFRELDLQERKGIQTTLEVSEEKLRLLRGFFAQVQLLGEQNRDRDLGLQEEILDLEEAIQAEKDRIREEELAKEEEAAAKELEIQQQLSEQQAALQQELDEKRKSERETQQEQAKKDLEDMARETARVQQKIGAPLEEAFVGFVSGAKTAREAMSDLLGDLSRQILRFIAQQAVQSFLNILLPGGGVVTGALAVAGFREGGEVPGPRVNRDIVPAALTPGEYVVRRGAVDHYGMAIMNAINQKAIPLDIIRRFRRGLNTLGPPGKFQQGGAVGAGAGTGGGGVSPAVVVASDKNMELLLRGGKNSVMQFFHENDSEIAAILKLQQG